MKHDSKTHGLLVVVIALGFGLIALAILFSPKQAITISGSSDAAQANTITVTGQSQFETDPDEAELFIKVMTEEATAKQAQEQNARLMNTVKAALEGDGIDDDQMETTSYSLRPQQKWNPETREYDKTGYVVQHLLKITTDDVTSVGDILDVAVDNGANGLDRVNFKLSDEKQADVNSEALAQAASSAEDKAEAITQSLGVRLGGINKISESNVQYNYYTRSSYDMMEEATVGASKSFSTEISPESVTVSARATLVYEIN